jgi:ribose 5-phosphate isomerase B
MLKICQACGYPLPLIKNTIMSRIVVPIGADHAGFQLKEQLINYLQNRGFEVVDYGCYSSESIDYPDFAHPVATYIEQHPGSQGILICGSGNGINMTANKHSGIRSALCWNTEIAVLSRQHNNANIIALPARFISTEQAIEMVDIFLHTGFEGGRHQQRIDKIACS